MKNSKNNNKKGTPVNKFGEEIDRNKKFKSFQRKDKFSELA